MKKNILKGALAAFACSLLSISSVQAQSFSETFNDITTLAGSGWVMTNASVAVGSTNWFQGTSVAGGGPFDSYNGAANAYIGANYNNTGSTGTISNWLMTPNRTFKNGDVITFYTRKVSPDTYADRLEVRLSTNGASTSVGTGSGVGDYTTLLMSVNPSLVLGVYPTTWTLYTITISGLPAPTSGRIGFRYFVTGGGVSGANSDYIGIDQVDYTPYVCPAFTMTPSSGALSGGSAGSAYSVSLSQTGALGTPNYAVTAGALPPGLTLSSAGTISGTPTATGTFNFTATVSDNSGCSGSSAYSITVVCPANPTSLNGLPTLCSNDAVFTLTEGSPAGGTYSGTGVTGGQFDPAAGTQTITYDYTDAYGCAHQSTNTITVNTAPSVTLASFTTSCSNDADVTLGGESPAGGTFSGTGVTAGIFDPSVGTQTITYDYTDGNGCSGSASEIFTVNTAPTVSQDPIADICENGGPITLTGGLPAGGTYLGTGVTAGDFDPAAGNQTITYFYTDGNGCTDMASTSITVIPSATATLSSFTAVCSNDGPVTLTEGSPSGGTYTGTGVSGNTFDPSVGSQLITYTVGGGSPCESSATATFNVNTAPNVALTLPTTVMCINHSAITLSGGSPAGGSYTGNGVSAGSFNPATAGLGNSSITYDYTDGNGCSGSAIDVINVDDCAGIDETSVIELSVSPNPSNGTFVLSGIDMTKLSNVVVQDMSGRTVDVTLQPVNGTSLNVSINEESTGMYVLSGNFENQLVRVRLIKN